MQTQTESNSILDDLIINYLKSNGYYHTCETFCTEAKLNPETRIKHDLSRLLSKKKNCFERRETTDVLIGVDHVSKCISYDSPAAIVYDKTILSATCFQLIDYLISRNCPTDYIRCFCCVYRTFANIEVVLDRLFFMLDGLTVSDPNDQIVCKNFFNVISFWMKKYPNDFTLDLLDKLATFRSDDRTRLLEQICKAVKDELLLFDDVLASSSRYLHNKYYYQQHSSKIRRPISTSFVLPAVLPSVICSKKFDILDIPSIELCRQLSLVHYDWFCNIEGIQLLNQVWNKFSNLYCPYSPVCQLVQKLKILALWIQTKTVLPEDVQTRVNRLQKFIDMAELFRRMNNIYASLVVVAALRSDILARLTKTWEQLDSGSKKRFEELETFKKEILELHKNSTVDSIYTRLRDNSPIIPYMDYDLERIEFIHESKSSISHRHVQHTNDKVTLVNWEKLSQLYLHVQVIEGFQEHNRRNQLSYPYVEIPKLRQALEESFATDTVEEGRLLYMTQKREFTFS